MEEKSSTESMDNAFDKEAGVNKPLGYSSSARWWTAIVGGVLALVVGILLLVWSKTTYDVLVLFLGIYLLVAGLIELSSSIMQASLKEPYGGKLAGAILAIVIGGLLLGFLSWEAAIEVVWIVASILLIVYGVANSPEIRGRMWALASINRKRRYNLKST